MRQCAKRKFLDASAVGASTAAQPPARQHQQQQRTAQPPPPPKTHRRPAQQGAWSDLDQADPSADADAAAAPEWAPAGPSTGVAFPSVETARQDSWMSAGPRPSAAPGGAGAVPRVKSETGDGGGAAPAAPAAPAWVPPPPAAGAPAAVEAGAARAGAQGGAQGGAGRPSGPPARGSIPPLTSSAAFLNSVLPPVGPPPPMPKPPKQRGDPAGPSGRAKSAPASLPGAAGAAAAAAGAGAAAAGADAFGNEPLGSLIRDRSKDKGGPQAGDGDQRVGGGKAEKERKPRDPNAPKKPKSAFMLFCKDNRNRVGVLVFSPSYRFVFPTSFSLSRPLSLVPAAVAAVHISPPRSLACAFALLRNRC